MNDPITISTAPSRIGAASERPPRGPIEPLPLWGEDGFGFSDLIDVVNPLQHVPFVNAVYREAAGDEIGPAPRLLGGALFGGPLGFAFGLIDVALEQATGRDLGENLTALAASFDLIAPEEPGPVASARVSPPPIHEKGGMVDLSEAAAAGLSRWVAGFDPPRAPAPTPLARAAPEPLEALRSAASAPSVFDLAAPLAPLSLLEPAEPRRPRPSPPEAGPPALFEPAPIAGREADAPQPEGSIAPQDRPPGEAALRARSNAAYAHPERRAPGGWDGWL